MKKYFSILLVFLMVLLPLKVKAFSANFWASASARTVTRGSNVTISYGFTASEDSGVEFSVSTSNAGVAPISISSDAFLPSKGAQSSLSFTANQVGSATITFSNIQVEGESGSATNLGSRSVTITVVEPQTSTPTPRQGGSSGGGSSSGGSSSSDEGSDISVAPPNQETKKPVDEKSNNSYLSSLKIDKGELEPQFNAEIFDYTVKLAAETKTVHISAIASDSKATLKNEETLELKEGSNKHEIVVTAEDETTRTYRINFVVDEKAKTTFEYRNKKIGVLSMLPEEKPQGYSETEIEINQVKVKALKNDTLKTILVYTVDELGNKKWMYSHNGKFSLYEEFQVGEKKYVLGFVDESVTKLGMIYNEVELFGKKIIGLQYDNEKLKRFVVVPLYNDKNELALYQIDTKENTIQVFADSFEKMNQEFEKIQLENQKLNNLQQILLIISIALGVITLGFIGLTIYLGLKLKK